MSVNRDDSGVACTKRQSRLRFADIMRTIYLSRPDIVELSKDNGSFFEWWLITNGLNEYSAIAEVDLPSQFASLTEIADEAIEQIRPTLTRFMVNIWSLRPDLQKLFDISTFEGQNGFIWWYFIHGFSEFGLAHLLTTQQRRELNEIDDRVPAGDISPLSRFMVELWGRRSDLQRNFDIFTKAGQDEYLAWYFTKGVLEHRCADLIDEVTAATLMTPTSETPDTPRIFSLLWAGDATIRETYASPSDPKLWDWASTEPAQSQFPVLNAILPANHASEPASISFGKSETSPLKYGANLIGYVRGQFGIGEDVRMAALSFKAAGIPFSIFNIKLNKSVNQDDHSADAYVSDDLPYGINIFCTTGMETARIAAQYGSKLFDNRPSIGYWPWEFQEWPEDWAHSYNLVDEIWASSHFTYEAFARSCTKPVRYMPMAVTVDQSAGLTRRDFNLPEDRFLFVHSFDFLSTMARKNPKACIDAFRTAFPRGDEPMGLVIKAMRAPDENEVWRKLVGAAALDSRILLINQTIDRPQLLDLYRACDCFVSLHRSEGFGRNLAEAMMLGKPVIATGYSGNMDFTLPGTASVVDFRLRRVLEDEYAFAGGLVWAEPDIGSAAAEMRRIAQSGALRERQLRLGRELVAGTYEPRAVGERYRIALQRWS